MTDNTKIKDNLQAVVDYLKTVDGLTYSEVRYIFRMDLYQIWLYRSDSKTPLTMTEEELEEKSPAQMIEEVALLIGGLND